MKSLEIVNEIINKLKGKPELEYWNGNKVNCLFHNEEGAGLLTCSLLEQIKVDLEVLEIIKKKYVDINLIRWLFNTNSIKQVLKKYNAEGNIRLTLEELQKIKQWLEENE